MEDVKKIIAESLKINGVTAEEIEKMLSVPPDAAMGEYALPCFKLAKLMRKSPTKIAGEIAENYAPPEGILGVSAVNGYLNFRVDRENAAKDILAEILSKKEGYGDGDEGRGKTICIDYSSVNIAKPFHIGHLLTTVIGGALCRIYKKLGYKVVGINHLGDWGTQFGKLIVAFKRWSNEAELEEKGIKVLSDIYVKFHEEADKNPDLNDEARLWFKKIEDGDGEATRLFGIFKDVTLREAEKIYERLHVKFDSYAGESFYNDKMRPVLKRLEEKGLLKESEGAKVVDLSEYGMSPCLILKADGATLYATRDLAAAFYRKKTYDFYKCLYVVAYQQNLHFRQVFKVLELMGEKWCKDLEHVPYGMVSLEDGAMSTRKGKVVLLSDVLDKAVAKSLKIIAEKSPDLGDKEKVAETVGVGAVVFSALYNNRIKDLVFDYDKVLNFDGETAPYVQYTAARCRSVLRKVGFYDPSDADYSGLGDPESGAVVTVLKRFPEAVASAAIKKEPCYISRFLVNLCKEFNRFYLVHRVCGESKGILSARAALTEAVNIVLTEGLRLLGISAPDKM